MRTSEADKLISLSYVRTIVQHYFVFCSRAGHITRDPSSVLGDQNARTRERSNSHSKIKRSAITIETLIETITIITTSSTTNFRSTKTAKKHFVMGDAYLHL